ncbi:response regulator transcription factor [Methylosinus sp. H3A]|uniref:response regulator transcription factor n=1 Tax=Methylosinus sp. H3A TaxID=2785786 RepID=UPI0018C35019|nr:response regulator transcription factor [Methylosinus sp. H3A]MBG0810551.1 response regulator transcription factor [Methylosinus sp. H3A]
MRILLVEDESEAARLIASLIGAAGFAVDRAASIAAAREAVAKTAYDLALLDRRLPDGDGLTLLAHLRAALPGVRVMMLTAMDSLDEKVSGLDDGADDYVTKPFQGEELIARIRACLRRPGGPRLAPIVVGALSFDVTTREVSIAGRNVALHRRELDLLEALIRRVSRVTPRETLFEEVFAAGFDVQDNALDTAISRLRRRLDALGAGVSVHTLRGVGYMLTEHVG